MAESPELADRHGRDFGPRGHVEEEGIVGWGRILNCDFGCPSIYGRTASPLLAKIYLGSHEANLAKLTGPQIERRKKIEGRGPLTKE
jgi:hypothetical protein